MDSITSFLHTQDATATRIALVCSSLFILYNVGLFIYNLYFHPLAKFPGSKLAASSTWYEFYHDYWRNGKYIFEIKKMHEKYGPIIRVTPDELSISDPEAYNDIYVVESKRRTDNYDIFCKGIDFDGSHLLTTGHQLHRRRRKPLEPFFSRKGVSQLQPVLADVAEKLASRLRALKGTSTIVRLDHAFSAFSGDIIARICWENQREFLDDPEFAPEWYDLIHTIVRSIPLFTGFPSLVQIASWLPDSFLLWAFPSGKVFNNFKTIALEQVAKAKQSKLENGGKDIEGDTQLSLLDYIVNSEMPESELSDDRLAKEAQVLMGGGTASTARTLGFASYYILARPEIRARLSAELAEPMANYPERIPSWAELEKLPFLQALIKESLRLSYGVMHRLPRVSPDVPIQYKQWTIPTGTPVGMSAYLQHSDDSVYPEADQFRPERWMEKPTLAMQRSYVPFCKGSRNCLGQNLAQAEMSLVLAVLYRPSGPSFELYETDETDVRHVHDFMIPLPKLDTKGVRIIVP